MAIVEVEPIGNFDSVKTLFRVGPIREQDQRFVEVNAQEINGVGCLVLVSSRNLRGMAEALIFVPDVRIAGDAGLGHKLVATNTFGGVKPTPLP